MTGFNGLGMNMGNLCRLSDAKSRSISAENLTGEKGKGGMSTDGISTGAARDLGQGWKVAPCVGIEAGQTYEIADIEGPGAIQQIWVTSGHKGNRFKILRIYWDDQEQPSVECPLGDFFANGWDDSEFSPVSSLSVCVNPRSGLNCYWEMPFRKRCRITLENISEEKVVLFYQVNYRPLDVICFDVFVIIGLTLTGLPPV